MRILNLIRHRITRIYQSYFPQQLTEDEHVLISSLSNSKLVDLFYEQPLSDQRHGLLVYNKAKQLFGFKDGSPKDEELLIASCFHDIAKKDSFKSTTLRIIAATLTDVLPNQVVNRFEKSKISFFRRIWIYANHSDLSFLILEPLNTGDFVKYATLFHHNSNLKIRENPTLERNVQIFIHADTL